MQPNKGVALFEQHSIRRVWHEGKWWFSVVDVVGALVPESEPRKYWYDMKRTITNTDFIGLISRCLVERLTSADGKLRETDCLAVEDLIQIIQFIPALRRQKRSAQEDGTTKSGIYAIVNTLTGERYIGSSIDISTRYLQHRSELRRGKHHSAKLQAAWEQYGEDAFILVILEEVFHPSELVQIEQQYLDIENNTYNIASSANNISSASAVNEDKIRRLIVFLEQEANVYLKAEFMEYLRFAIDQGIVIPGPKYHLLLQAAKANMTTWETFRDYIVNS